ncbi:MAG TPA: class II aldolase/adducin family protein [Candidatus Hydrogenedentes bacterium]|nr:MAG: short chain dehydrogenase [Candidatus Hydrogenedentes bacterium ADurb.Bin179]HOH30008.1 class II aldolase/adducin family protein [Candidatus Hydrogenedentota bacterium]
MSQYLGDISKGYAILGEGNTSARIDEDSLYIKASGTCLGTMKATDFLPVSISRVTRILEAKDATDADVKEVLRASLLDPGETRMPSVETMMHALLYAYPEYRFIGHTHPVATNGLLCSMNAETALSGRLCPDHIVVMGRATVFVPYVDPGLVLAREVRDRVRSYIERENELPKAIALQNHGLFALGPTAKAVMNITDMAEKMSHVLLGAYGAGGPNFMTASDIDRIATRPDEKYRQERLD